jgi:hypothetical protein
MFRGDSSLRGVWLALYQQLVPDTIGVIMDFRSWNPIVGADDTLAPGVQRYSAFGWIDVILEEVHADRWKVVAATSGGKSKGSGFETAQPVEDQSNLLTPLWCNRSELTSRSHVRLTWAFLTRSRFTAGALTSSLDAWRTTPCRKQRSHIRGAYDDRTNVISGPDAILLTAGAWDVASATNQSESRDNMIRAWMVLREDAQYSGRLLGYAAGLEACGAHWSDLKWQASFIDAANKGGSGPSVAFIERHTPGKMLASLSPNCSGSVVDSGVHPWHPPHAANVALLPSLLDIWLGRGQACHDGAATCAALISLLANPGERDCCVQRPSTADLPDGGFDESTSYWARQCRLTTPIATKCAPAKTPA